MPAPRIAKQVGRRAFGLDPANYHSSRPDYPEWVYQTLHSRCGLGHGAVTFEVGAGTGTTTRRLLDLGADPLIAVEPDARLADFLRTNNPDRALKVLVSAFEDVELEESAFDLGVSAKLLEVAHTPSPDLDQLTRVEGRADRVGRHGVDGGRLRVFASDDFPGAPA